MSDQYSAFRYQVPAAGFAGNAVVVEPQQGPDPANEVPIEEPQSPGPAVGIQTIIPPAMTFMEVPPASKGRLDAKAGRAAPAMDAANDSASASSLKSFSDPNEDFVTDLFSRTGVEDVAPPDVAWETVGTACVDGPPSEDVIPRLRATTAGNEDRDSDQVPAHNAVFQPPASHAKIVPHWGETLWIPPAAVEQVPATGPDYEQRMFPGFPGPPTPESEVIAPRSAQPQSTDTVR